MMFMSPLYLRYVPESCACLVLLQSGSPDLTSNLTQVLFLAGITPDLTHRLFQLLPLFIHNQQHATKFEPGPLREVPMSVKNTGFTCTQDTRDDLRSLYSSPWLHHRETWLNKCSRDFFLARPSASPPIPRLNRPQECPYCHPL